MGGLSWCFASSGGALGGWGCGPGCLRDSGRRPFSVSPRLRGVALWELLWCDLVSVGAALVTPGSGLWTVWGNTTRMTIMSLQPLARLILQWRINQNWLAAPPQHPHSLVSVLYHLYLQLYHFCLVSFTTTLPPSLLTSTWCYTALYDGRRCEAFCLSEGW